MRLHRAEVLLLGMVVPLGAGCQTLTLAFDPSDGGAPDARATMPVGIRDGGDVSASRGATGDARCDGTACSTGATCQVGTCSGSSSSSRGVTASSSSSGSASESSSNATASRSGSGGARASSSSTSASRSSSGGARASSSSASSASASSGDADAGHDGGRDGALDAGCSPGATECTSDTQVATCGSGGEWGSATTCLYACVGTVGTVGGSCGGVCVPGTTDCTSDTEIITTTAAPSLEAAVVCGDVGRWGTSGAIARGSGRSPVGT